MKITRRLSGDRKFVPRGLENKPGISHHGSRAVCAGLRGDFFGKTCRDLEAGTARRIDIRIAARRLSGDRKFVPRGLENKPGISHHGSRAVCAGCEGISSEKPAATWKRALPAADQATPG